MEPSATRTIVQGTLITSAASAFVTGLYGVIQRHPHSALLAGTAALNTGITAVTFFGIREYVVSPALVHSLPFTQYVRRRHDFGIDLDPTDPSQFPSQSWTDLRMSKLLDSGISGAATGGIIRGWRSGQRAALSGSLAAAAVCSLLQLAYNEIGVAKLRYVSQARTDLAKSTAESSISSSSVQPMLRGLLELLGVHKVSEDDYVAKMKKTRQVYLDRIDVLERQLEGEHRTKDKS